MMAPLPGVRTLDIHAPATVDEVTHHVRVEQVAGHCHKFSIPLSMLAMVYSFTFCRHRQVRFLFGGEH